MDCPCIKQEANWNWNKNGLFVRILKACANQGLRDYSFSLGQILFYAAKEVSNYAQTANDISRFNAFQATALTKGRKGNTAINVQK